MAFLSAADWKRLYDCIAELSEAESLPDFDHRLLEKIRQLLPTDLHTDMFELSSSGVLRLADSAGPPIDPRWLALWEDRYRFVVPPVFDRRKPLQVVDWCRTCRDEYAALFILPQGIGASLYLEAGREESGVSRVIVVHRPRGRRFGLRDLAIAEALAGHLPALRLRIRRLELREEELLLRVESAVERGRLSRREMEVAGFLCRRLSVPEIGARLRLSPRTVETYAARAYEKLGVYDRRGLIRKVLAEERTT